MAELENRGPDRLVSEVFAGDWEAGPLAEAALAAARRVRRRRTIRRIASASTAIAAVAAMAVLALESQPGHLPSKASAALQSPGSASFPALEIISDDELVSLVADRPVLLVRDAGRIRSVVWLAEENAGNARGQ